MHSLIILVAFLSLPARSHHMPSNDTLACLWLEQTAATDARLMRPLGGSPLLADAWVAGSSACGAGLALWHSDPAFGTPRMLQKRGRCSSAFSSMFFEAGCGLLLISDTPNHFVTACHAKIRRSHCAHGRPDKAHRLNGTWWSHTTRPWVG